MYLFFDTETTGLPQSWNAPLTNLKNWPRLVQLAYVLCDFAGNELLSESYIIKPVGFVIPIEASHIHGISNERAEREGNDLHEVLQKFHSMVEQSEVVIAHNMSFDEKIVGAEFLRAEFSDALASKHKICTMQAATNYCAIPGSYGYKWPKLTELHYKLFQKDFEGAHNAASDVLATVKCFWELKRLGIVEI